MDDLLYDTLLALLESEDNTGCSDDLTVVSFDAIQRLREIMLEEKIKRAT